jgi:phosphoribosylformimino-5-aminoimidazole carboxamide ribotide isomerase
VKHRFELFPAIDVRAGRVVRLERGEFDRETSYSDDPAAQARLFVAEGARWIHVVDLDAARTGDQATNRQVIESICAAVRDGGARVQCGGGVRDQDSAAARFGLGVDRVVVGTAAIEDPTLVRRLADRWPDRVVVGLDVRGDTVATHGWTSDSGRRIRDVLRELPARGIAATVVTQIAVDGTLEGPDLSGLATVLAQTTIPVIASGGVASIGDLERLAGLEIDGRRLAGAIVGRALYEGRFTLRQALAATMPAAAG